MKKLLSTNVAAIVLIAAFALVSFTSTTEKVETTPMINTYKVITGDTPSKLQYEAVKALAAGYQYQGGVTYSDGVYAQAVVR